MLEAILDSGAHNISTLVTVMVLEEICAVLNPRALAPALLSVTCKLALLGVGVGTGREDGATKKDRNYKN